MRFPRTKRSNRQQWASRSIPVASEIHPDAMKKGNLRECSQKRNIESIADFFVPSSSQTTIRRNQSREMEADLDGREKYSKKHKMP
jgi:hypothetical protein